MNKTMKITPPNLRLKANLDARATELSRKHNADFQRGPFYKGKDNELFPCALAMVEVALDLNAAVRLLYVDIIRAWDKPGCANFAPKAEIERWVNDFPSSQSMPLERSFNNYIERCRNSKDNLDILDLLKLADDFILKGFNGPIEPAIHNRWVHKARPVPKYNERVTSEGAWPLLVGVFYLTWCEYEGMDLKELDRMKMGQNYEVVTSGAKPSTNWGRSQKPRINKLCRDMGMSFINYDTIRKGAEKWYQARVIRGSIVDAASDYEINNPSTFSRLIENYDRIAGLR